MNILRIVLRPILWLLLLFTVLAGTGLYLVLQTRAGPPLLLAAARLGGVNVRAEKLEGSLRDGVRFEQLFLNGTPLFGAPGTLRLVVDLHAVDAFFRLGENVILLEKKPDAPLRLHASLPEPALLHPALRPLKARFTLDATAESTEVLQLRTTIGPMTFTPGPDIHLTAENAILNARITQSGLDADARLIVDKQHAVNLTAHLAGYRAGMPDKKQPLAVSIHTEATLQELLQKTETELPLSGGTIDVRLDVGGTVGSPDVRGLAHLQNVHATPPETGLTFTLPHLRLQTHNATWRMEGTLESSQQMLTLNGEGSLSPIGGSLRVQGENFPVMNTPEFAMKLSPNLVLTREQNLWFVRGTVLIPEARIAPIRFQNTVNLSDDVVFTGKGTPETRPRTPPPAIGLDVTATMGEKVDIDVRGLKARLTGALQLRESPPAPLTINGELTLVDGRYNAYGQDLAITEGSLTLAGADIDNPSLRLRAERAFDKDNRLSAGSSLFDYTNTRPGTSSVPENLRAVGIEVQGRLNTPKIQLYSRPAGLTQADMLSMLLLGKPANQANKAGARLLLTALSAMNTGTGSKSMQLIQQLQQKTGIDVNMQDSARVNQQTGAITESTSLVVGKAIGKRLYLSYNTGLSQPDNNFLTLRYLLNTFLSLQVSSGTTGNGLDILYTRTGKPASR